MVLTFAQLESLKTDYSGVLLTQESGEEFERAIDRWAGMSCQVSQIDPFP